MTLSNLRRGGSLTTLRRPDSLSNGINQIDPWNDFTTMDRLFDNFFRNPFIVADRASSLGQSTQNSQIELYETNDELVAYIFCSGLDASELDVSATSDVLSIRGERKPRQELKDGMICHTPWITSAISTATFGASYTLPTEINPEKVNATYRDGILEVHMAKHEATKPKQVKVQVGAQ